MSGQEDISERMVQDRNRAEFDKDVLHRKSFQVNMRLFKSSLEYRTIILSIIQYMEKLLEAGFSNYPALKGISGANVGVPLNIIGVMTMGKPMTFINPNVIRKSEETSLSRSNCGSILLDAPVEVKRHKWIYVSYYTRDGAKREGTFDGRMGKIMQHEIDHNNGILITDKKREVRNGEKPTRA